MTRYDQLETKIERAMAQAEDADDRRAYDFFSTLLGNEGKEAQWALAALIMRQSRLN